MSVKLLLECGDFESLFFSGMWGLCFVLRNHFNLRYLLFTLECGDLLVNNVLNR